MILISKLRYLLYFLFVFISFLAQAQDSLKMRIDSIYSYDTLRYRNVEKVYFFSNEEDLTFFINNPNPKDSIYFQWLGIDKFPVFLKNRELRYTNIKGGNYQFMLIKNQFGKSDMLVKLPIVVGFTIVEEPFFIPSLVISLLIIFASIVYLWLSYNFRQKAKMQGLRNQIASDLHDEVGSTLSSIAVLSKVLRRNIGTKAPESLPILDKILMTSKETIINLRDTVWAINPENDSFEKLMGKMRVYANEMILGEEMTLVYYNVFEENDSKKVPFISMEQRRNVYMMFKECIHNIVKHSKATAVEIHISMEKDKIRIFISDNGIGFDTHFEKDGNGLDNLKRRAKDCFIDLSIESKLGNGTTIVMLIPEL